MGNAISIIIALVGVLNFVNSMVTAILSRKREFAVIQSVGMTKRQLSRMLTAEGLYYAALTLAASYLNQRPDSGNCGPGHGGGGIYPPFVLPCCL